MVLFFLYIFSLFFIISVLFVTLSFKLEFENFKIIFPKVKGENSKASKIKLKIYIFRKIEIASIDLKKTKKEKIKFKQIQNLVKKYKNKDKSFNIKITDVIKELNITTEKINIDIIVGSQDAAITAIIVGILYAVLENLVISKVKKIENQNCKITPNYDKEMLFVKFDGIFEINMWNIINIVFKELKRRVSKNGRTSNRTTYAYSNE